MVKVGIPLKKVVSNMWLMKKTMGKNHTTQRLIVFLVTFLLTGCFIPVPIPIPISNSESQLDVSAERATQTEKETPMSQPLLEKVVGEWDIKQDDLEGGKITFFQDGTLLIRRQNPNRYDYFVTEYKILDERRILFTQWYNNNSSVMATFLSPRSDLVILEVKIQADRVSTYRLENRKTVAASPTEDIVTTLTGYWEFYDPDGEVRGIQEFLGNGQMIVIQFDAGKFRGGTRFSYQFIADDQFELTGIVRGEPFTDTFGYLVPAIDTLIFVTPGMPVIVGQRIVDRTLQLDDLAQTLPGVWRGTSSTDQPSPVFEFLADGLLIFTDAEGRITLNKYEIIGNDIIKLARTADHDEIELFVVQLSEDTLALTNLGSSEAFQIQRQ